MAANDAGHHLSVYYSLYILCSVQTLKSVFNVVSVSVVLATILCRFVRSVAQKRSKLGVLRRQAINVGDKEVKFLNAMNQ